MMRDLKQRLKRAILHRLVPNDFYFSQAGFCPCCNASTEFLSYNSWLRDNFLCVNCKSIPRQRAIMKVIDSRMPGWRGLSIHESSPSSGGASGRIRVDCEQYQSSQYFPNVDFGSMVDGQRNENLEAMTFPDESFDLFVTQDVLEHVYDHHSVFREIARTLKPGGCHIFTVPLVNKHRPSQVWATRNPDGSPNFLHEPDYHGNPVDPRGSPVTMCWGYDIVDFIEDACGLKTDIEYLDDLGAGVRAEFIEVLVTTKPHS